MFNMASEGRTLTRLSLLKQLFSTGTCDCNLNCTLGKVKFRADFRFEKYTGFFFFLSLSNFHSYYFAFLADSEDSGVFQHSFRYVLTIHLYERKKGNFH